MTKSAFIKLVEAELRRRRATGTRVPEVAFSFLRNGVRALRASDIANATETDANNVADTVLNLTAIHERS